MHALLIVIFIQTDGNLNELLKIAYLVKFSKNMIKNYFLNFCNKMDVVFTSLNL